MIRDKVKDNIFPVLYSIFFVGFFFFPSTKTLSNFFYVFVAFPFLGMALFKKVDFLGMFASKAFVISLVFLFYMWLTLFWAKDFNGSDIMQYGRRVLYIACFLAATVHLIRSCPDFLRRLTILFCWTAAIVSVVYSVYYYMRNPFPENRLWGYGLLHNPIRTASVYGVALVGCLYLAFKRRSGKDVVVYGIVAISILAYMLLSQARGPVVSIVITMIVWQAILFYKVGLKRGLSGKFALLLVLFLFAVAGLFVAFPEFFRYFVLERGLSYRLEIWGNFLKMIESDPFFGYGLNADTTTFMSDGREFLHPHSVYMATFYYGGLIGLILQFVLIGYCLFKSATMKSRPESFLATCSLLFGALCIATDGNTLIQHPKPFWIFHWFPVALAAAFELEEKVAVFESSGGNVVGSQA